MSTEYCNECDTEVEVDEPSGLCFYSGYPHGYPGTAPGPCDCGAVQGVLCDECKNPPDHDLGTCPCEDCMQERDLQRAKAADPERYETL